MGFTKFGDLNPWKLGGYGMYSDYHPDSYFVWFQIDDNKVLARKTKLFSTNAKFRQLVLKCRSYPSTNNLKKLHAYFKHTNKGHFKVEAWRLNFTSESLKLNQVLVNSYEE
ncbi:hypothetical protein SAMN04488514_11584 [Kriegella aquimaris]|uniref:Uncharacterized protein n=2 Tax=Kriegella aquimaris TaxID=192904 RepID=A0A1G9WF00_9FLAO|nr:hypothetical protein SAMN04488514_11584 [Kriegella aquimaris]